MLRSKMRRGRRDRRLVYPGSIRHRISRSPVSVKEKKSHPWRYRGTVRSRRVHEGPPLSQTASDQMTRARQLQKLRFRGCCLIYHKSTRTQRESGRRRDVVLNAYVETECPPDGSMCPPWGGREETPGLRRRRVLLSLPPLPSAGWRRGAVGTDPRAV